MTREDITRELLEEAAADLNKVILDSESAIQIADVMESALEADVMEVGGILIANDMPGLKPETKDALRALGIELFAKKKDTDEIVETEAIKSKKEDNKAEEISTKTNTESQNQEKKEKIETNKNNTKKIKYTRVQAFCDALKGEAKTLTEIAKKAKELYDKLNSEKKQPKFVHIEWEIRTHFMPSLVILGFVIVKDKKYSLK